MKNVFYLCLLLIALIACNKEEASPDANASTRANLIGTWDMTKYKENGVEFPVTTQNSAYLTFNQDSTLLGRLVADGFLIPIDGTFRVFENGKKIGLIYTFSPGEVIYTINSIDAKNMNLTLNLGSVNRNADFLKR